MVRRIIHIDEEKCNGCGLCAKACHEDAIGMVDGKAKLLRDDYCDGLGDCLPTCPTGAIRFVEREAAAYDHQAVMENQRKKQQIQQQPLPCGCPGSMAKALHPVEAQNTVQTQTSYTSELRQWPVQIKLVPITAPWFENAHLLIAADCSAYANPDFHQKFMKGKITIIGCPKLDEGDYTEKLTEIIKNNTIKSVTIVRMEVPCCGGIQRAAENALQKSGKFIPWQVITLATNGKVLE